MKFFFVYKALAHPELAGDYVQPFTLKERLAHAKQAEKQLGATIPWLVDGIDNAFKHAMGDRANSEYVIDPQGRIVVKRAWSDPAAVRRDLERLIGPVPRITPVSEIKLKIEPPIPAPAARGIVPRLKREKMGALAMRPEIDPRGPPFFAKLRAEADESLLTNGRGRLYLGFHLDPLHRAHWNNLTRPLRWTIEPAEGLAVEPANGSAPAVEAGGDSDPREFLVDVSSWPEDVPLRVTVAYFACTEDKTCHAVRQSYTVHRRRDRDGGAARGEGAGWWDPAAFARQMLLKGKNNGDGRLSRDEVMGPVGPQFDRLDTNRDGYLDFEELKASADWLNRLHEPLRGTGTPEIPGRPKRSEPPQPTGATKSSP